jgi:hypothetical protein
MKAAYAAPPSPSLVQKIKQIPLADASGICIDFG